MGDFKVNPRLSLATLFVALVLSPLARADIDIVKPQNGCAESIENIARAEEVLRGIRALVRHNLSCDPAERIDLNYSKLKWDKSERTTRVLKDAGVNIRTGAILHRRALTLFENSWDLALKNAGEDPLLVRKETKVLTRKKFIKLIQHLDKAGVDLQSNVFRHDQSAETKTKIRKALGEDFSPWTIHARGTELFEGDWYKGLDAAGVKSEKYKSDYNLARSVTPQNVGPLLRALDTAGVNLSTKAFISDESEITMKIVEKVLGKRIQTETIHRYVREMYFGDWYLALESNQVDPAKYRKYYKWTREDFLKAGHILLGAKAGQDLMDLISKTLGRRVSHVALKAAVHRAHFVNSIHELVEYTDLRSKVTFTQWPKPKIRKALRALYDAGFLPSSGLLQNTKGNLKLEIESMKILYAATGGYTTMRSLINATSRAYDGLDAALKDAGLDPEEIRQKEKQFWWKDDPMAIPLALIALDESGISPSHATLSTDNPEFKEAIAHVLEQTLGQKVYPMSLLRAIQVYYSGGLTAALLAAGLNPEEVDQARLMDWRTKIPELKQIAVELRAKGLVPSVEILTTSNETIRESIQLVFQKVLGQTVYPLDYARAVNRFYENEISEDPRAWTLKKKVYAHSPKRPGQAHPERGTADRFPWLEKRTEYNATLRALHAAGIPPNRSNFYTEDPEQRAKMMAIIKENLGREFTPISFYHAVHDRYHSLLFIMLRDAGLDPAEILVNLPAHLRRTSLPTQLEFNGSKADGTLSGGRLVGKNREASSSDVDQHLDANALANEMTSTIDTSHPEELTLLHCLLHVVADLKDTEIDIPHLTATVNKKFNRRFEENQVEELFEHLRANPVLSNFENGEE